ncbi:DUF6894 family protein [Aurantimonas coralicida]|uniref:DUF6894 family protein n=1 Tax=Aurantimonas coralicida TaxID=182270 RepID=UPI001D1987FF|nr:hypothetical protein [Aurantimonas coralicida]MCC4300312.1 hypothetical protein [Aurantimonas coralicida]
MPVYFFDVQDEEKFIEDEVGLECEAYAAIRKAAIAALPDMAQAVMPDGDHHVIKVTVRDESGKKIFAASLTLEAQWLDAN